MTYAEEMGPVIREGIACRAITDITKLLEAPNWLRENPHTACPACGGLGRIPFQVAPSVHLPAVCAHCFGGGEIAYVSAN